jgi:DNA polymerase/3'-5' exonuclease PolX
MAHATAAMAALSRYSTRWCIAGSLRRGRSEVHDIEHVMLPVYGTVPVEGSLFPREANLLWHALEAMARAGTARPHNYRASDLNPMHRLGDRYRGYDLLFRGEWVHHEFFAAEPTTWGAILTIRTGPPLFSELVMRAFNARREYRQKDGELVDLTTLARVPVTSEEAYLALAGLPFVEPHNRDQYARTHA